MYAAVASTVSVLRSAVVGTETRKPSKCVAGSSGSPLSVIASTDGAIRSTKVAVPGAELVNDTVVVLRNVVSDVVRSRVTS